MPSVGEAGSLGLQVPNGFAGDNRVEGAVSFDLALTSHLSERGFFALDKARVEGGGALSLEGFDCACLDGQVETDAFLVVQVDSVL